ncbi:Activated CDC42 kinase 1 [Hypsibius exemplaris]|uniref:non-specific protein-tyrosine kinase n=1 Tax=Hypsibius exemplaris TaxID=2072580 RepID=A0A1W0WTI5_HYPEX|nr:Activated CDC42 kinase 1 [Hypsibius exemplaris]
MDNRRIQEDSLELVFEVLKEVELEEYFPRIRDDLNLTRLAHFDHVKVQDFAQIGLGRPAGRRLLSAVKRRKTKLGPHYLDGLFDLFNPKTCGSRGQRRDANREEPLYSNVAREGAVSCLITSRDIELKERLGQGSFGEVMKAEWKREDGRTVLVAVKMLRSDALALQGAFGEFVKEVNAMIGLNHPNLIKLYGVSLSSPYMIVQELAALGSVLDRLRKECSLTSVAILVEWAKQICNGMAYLERQRWVHRDLAARNVLLSALNKIKIGDFGLMKSLNPEEDCYVMTEHKKIPFPWCAPECLKKRQFSHASDCWAYAVTLWEIFTFGEHPWAGNTGAQILQLIDQEGQRLPKPKACPPEIYRIMLHCWSHRESDRPTFAALTEFFRTVQLEVLKATKSFEEADRLQLNEGDAIFVIDGQPENHWWIGQNKRTFHIGTFPRVITKVLVPSHSNSRISQPLRYSFIHAGHGDTDPAKTFGNPSAIDDIYLRNPVPPPDLLGKPAPLSDFSSAMPKISAAPQAPVKLPHTPGVVDSEEVLLDLISEPPVAPHYNPLPAFRTESHQQVLHGNDFSQNQPDVNYFNVPPGSVGSFAQGNHVSPTAPAYHYYTPSPHATLPLPQKPINPVGLLNRPDQGMLYSNVILPTVSPNYSPNTYYNTASFVVRPAPAPPIPQYIPVPPPVVQQSLLPLISKPVQRVTVAKVGKDEKVIKTFPVPLSIDPFDTTLVSSDLWSGLKEKLPVKSRTDAYRDNTTTRTESSVATGGKQTTEDMLFGDFAQDRVKQDNTLLSSANLTHSLSHKNRTTCCTSAGSGWPPTPPTSANHLSAMPGAVVTKPLAVPLTTNTQKALIPYVSPSSRTRAVQDDSGNSSGSGGSGSGESKRHGASSVLDDMLLAVEAAVPGESAQAYEEALRACRFDQLKAVRELKVKVLLRLAVANETDCRRVLEKTDWNVTEAGAQILDL